LDAAIGAVVRERYSVQRIALPRDATLLRDVTRALRWEEHLGYEPNHLNLDALNDALRCEPCGERPRLVLILEGFDDLHRRDRAAASLCSTSSKGHRATTCSTARGSWLRAHRRPGCAVRRARRSRCQLEPF
jgi:hypothetical protein